MIRLVIRRSGPLRQSVSSMRESARVVSLGEERCLSGAREKSECDEFHFEE